MKVIFENTTIYTPRFYKDFIYFHSNKYGMTNAVFTITFTLLLLYCIIMNILQKNFIVSLIFLLILLGLIAYKIYLPVCRLKKTLKNQKNKQDNTFNFKFYDKYFKVNDKQFYYIDLHRIFETKNFYYLYLNKEKAALLSKSGFKKGNPIDFSDFIKKKCFLKFKKEL